MQDVRFALRAWRRAPGLAITAIATLALGIGANTAIFSVVSAVLLRPPPYANADTLVRLYETKPPSASSAGFDGPVVYPDFEQWRSQSKLFDWMIAYRGSSANLQVAGDPVHVQTVAAGHALFSLLGVQALMGRTFTPGDPSNVIVVSYGLWKNYLGGDPSVIGRKLTLDGEPCTLIGVMPETFQFPYGSPSTALWIPWDLTPMLRARPNPRLDAVLARMKTGVSIEAARQELAAMEGPSQAGREVRVQPLKDVVAGPVRHSLMVLLGAVGMVLLVACVNVANLMLARTAARSREIAIRIAVGAGRLRLLRQFLTESLLLALAGALAGLALAVLASRILVPMAAARIPRLEDAGLDWRVFSFLLAICLITGFGVGLAPAIAAARSLRTQVIGPWLRNTLVIAQLAIAFVLLAGAGLLVRTFLNLQRTSSGVNVDNVLTAHVVVSAAGESIAIEERVARTPGVRAAGLISLLPLQDSDWKAGFTIEGRPGVLQTELRYVTPGYFRAMGIPILRGRGFSPHDGPDVPRRIIVNEALARQYFPNEDPIGRQTDRGTIIGIAGDVRQASLRVPAKPEIFYTVAQNFAQIRRLGSTLVVRGHAQVNSIREAVREVSPGQALFRVATMRRVIEESLAPERLYAWLLALFAAMAALMAMAGIYGVISYLVTLRTREFGIRMAIGADPSRVKRLVLGGGARLITIGLALGLAAATLLTRLLGALLYGIEPTDLSTFSLMAALLAAAALAACLIPARRAAGVNPSVALRSE